MSDKKNKKSGLGIAIWIFAFLIILIVYLVNSENIKNNLKSTKFFEKISGEESSEQVVNQKSAKIEKKTVQPKETVLKVQKKETQDVNQNKSSEPKHEAEKKEVERKSEAVEKKVIVEPQASKKQEDLSSQIKIIKENRIESAKIVPKPKTVIKEPDVRVKPKIEPKPESEKILKKTSICFVAIDNDGPVIRKMVTRNVDKENPLKESLVSLLKGPTSNEISSGCRTLIPEGTKLYSVAVKNGTALINFSEEFEFNSYGVEGFLGQLMQIVFTATSFSTVNSVQILIEGKRKEYLGSEGVWIGTPLTKESFK